MKKILVLLSLLSVSLLSAVVVSCSKESNDIPDVPKKAIAVAFNTGSLYNDLGILESMADVVSPAGNYLIIDSVLVYDNNGVLVTKSGMESNSFEKKELVMKDLPKGMYTLVLWQSVYRTSDGIRAWKIEEEESLSTVKVASDGGSFNYFWALGISSAKVEHSGKGIQVDMTPKAVGYIVDVTIDNYPEDKGYTDISIVGGKHSAGVYLDPSRKDDPWVASQYSGSLFKAIPGNNGKGKFFSLLHGDDLYLWIRGDKSNSYDELGYIPHKNLDVKENYTFYFDYARATWQPAFLGSAQDFVEWKADRDAGILVIDPCLDWGSNLSYIEDYVHQKNWWNGINEELYQSGDLWSKAYMVSPSMKEQYEFETQDGQNLCGAVCFCDDPSIPVKVAYDIILIQKGFNYVGEIQYPNEPQSYSYYVSADKSSQAILNTNSVANWAIGYEPYYEDDMNYVVPAADLGLSVKWGICNLGAEQPEEPGDFFAWGEVEPYYSSLDPLTWKEGKEAGYDWPSYSMCDGTATGFTKYFDPDYDETEWCYWAGQGEPDRKMVLDPEDDAAHVILGGSWRMPTRAEIEELVATKNNENYKWEFKSLNGHEGLSVTYIVNNNSIFLPFTGFWDKTTHTTDFNNVKGFYWSSALTPLEPFDCISLIIGENAVSRNFMARTYGLAIRPVTE